MINRSHLRTAAIAAFTVAASLVAAAQADQVPPGFTRIFNGKNADGWHGSRTVHHGTTAVAKVADGALVLEPYPYGQGGLLLSDRSYKDFELYLEARPDPGYNSGIFLRSTEGGSAQAQWKAVMKTNPSIFQAGKVSDDAERHPVENVTWEDAQAFVRRLNALEKTHVYRLPTEFEWEYAARAGEDADTPWTVIRERAVAGYNAFFTTQMVGSKQPNAWGPYDMQGNVWEWVQDYYNEKPFADPTPPRSGKVRVLKGGGFAADVKNAIPATHAAGPGSKFDVGFRIVRETKP